ncbi:MAG: LysM peptidoglycan-binding domain-containing protein [Chloroflexi bacterium]|nr:LysM peptidoglycan-binding domain-containing protein [Chloroflexota bacterium]
MVLILSLTACAQSASVGIPTSNAVAAIATPNPVAPVATLAETTIAATQAPATPQNAQPEPAATPVPPTATLAPAPTAVPDTSSIEGDMVCNKLITYIVRPGDNLFRIALRYRTTAAAIARRNGISNVRVIHTGQKLRILTCG